MRSNNLINQIALQWDRPEPNLTYSHNWSIRARVGTKTWGYEETSKQRPVACGRPKIGDWWLNIALEEIGDSKIL